ncbi:MAG: hypothetical protein M3396_01040, partial [Actinomycetota bacterium]|nr:hypothetical protein [Actinomycetota bacterium]
MTSEEGVWVAAVAVVTVLWVVAALLEGAPAPVDTTAAGAAAAAGTAAVVGAAWGFRSTRPSWLAGLNLLLLPVAAAATTGGSAPVLPITLLVLAGAEVIASLTSSTVEGHRAHESSSEETPAQEGQEVWVQTGLVLLSAGLLVGALAAGHQDDQRWALVPDGGAAAFLGMAAAAVLVAVAALGPTGGRAYAVPGLLVGWVVAPGLSSLALAVTGGALAILSAALLGRRPGVALGFAGLAAAAFPAGRPAAALLLAGAALALAYVGDHPVAGLLGLPGAAAFAMVTLSSDGGAVPFVLAAAIAVTAGFLALAGRHVSSGQDLELGYLSWAALPAAALGAWLLVAPGSWAWTGASGLGAYDRGAAA